MAFTTFIAALALWFLPAGRPASPYIDVGACPFECCVLRDWRAEKQVVLFNHPDGSKVGRLNSGEWVKALQSETHSIPLAMKATRDIPEAGIHPGDSFYVLHYEGEMYWKIWYEGKVFDAESGDPRVPKMTWWVRVRRKDGSTGWVKAGGAVFSNQDQCGSAGPM